MVYLSLILAALFLNMPDLALANIKCFNIAESENLESDNFIVESSFLKGSKIHKKIYISKNKNIQKREVSTSTDFTSKKKGPKEKRQYVKEEFLLEFILSKNIRPQTVYEVPLKSGTAHFQVKTLTPPFSELKIESQSEVLSAQIKHNGLSEMKLNKLHFQKSNLTLLPCSLDTRAKIFKNKDVSSFIGDQVAQAIYK